MLGMILDQRTIDSLIKLQEVNLIHARAHTAYTGMRDSMSMFAKGSLLLAVSSPFLPLGSVLTLGTMILGGFFGCNFDAYLNCDNQELQFRMPSYKPGSPFYDYLLNNVMDSKLNWDFPGLGTIANALNSFNAFKRECNKANPHFVVDMNLATCRRQFVQFLKHNLHVNALYELNFLGANPLDTTECFEVAGATTRINDIDRPIPVATHSDDLDPDSRLGYSAQLPVLFSTIPSLKVLAFKALPNQKRDLTKLTDDEKARVQHEEKLPYTSSWSRQG